MSDDEERIKRGGGLREAKAKELKTAWDLYFNMFKDGDEVIVIDEDDNFHWGWLEYTDERELSLVRISGRSVKLKYEEIRFMAHDGFPVRQLLGADGNRSIENWRISGSDYSVRRALIKELRNQRPARIRRSAFGDPFMIESVEAELYFPDRLWTPAYNLFPELYNFEEVVVMKARDGAGGMLWDLKTVFFFE